MSEKLMYCGYCCLMISIWGTIQLGIMSVCYSFEAVTLYEDCEVHSKEYVSYDQFIALVTSNYFLASKNCLGAAIIYLVLVFISIGCIRVANQKMKQRIISTEDDDIFCTPKGFY